MIEKNKIKVVFGGKNLVLNFSTFDSDNQEVDIDDILTTDYAQLIGELITFPLVLNKIGLMVADQEAEVAKKKLDLQVSNAQITENARIKLIADGKKGTVSEVEAAVNQDKSYVNKQLDFIEAEKFLSYMQSIYFAAKDKSKKLDNLYMKTVPKEHEEEILEGAINGVMIKKANKLIPDAKTK